MSYGWRDFDQAVVAAIASGDEAQVVKRPGGGMRCPFVGHDDWLAWREDAHSNGTVEHGTPAVSFRVTPTYVLADRVENFIAGEDLVRAAIRGDWGKAETHRLGHENSEDALSFNVFRSLQEAGALKRVAQLVDATIDLEPDLFLWGRQISADGSSGSWDELQQIRGQVEPSHRQQTEPDICLHVPGWGWIFIEAKFDFGIKTCESEDKKTAWLALYPRHSPALFDIEKIAKIAHNRFPEQILRNMVFADLIRAPGEHAHVVALGRALDKTPIDEMVTACIADGQHVTTSRMSWEQIYHELPHSGELGPLRTYFENKGHSLRPAFSLHERA